MILNGLEAMSDEGALTVRSRVSEIAGEIVELGPVNATIHSVDEHVRIDDLTLLDRAGDNPTLHWPGRSMSQRRRDPHDGVMHTTALLPADPTAPVSDPPCPGSMTILRTPSASWRAR